LFLSAIVYPSLIIAKPFTVPGNALTSGLATAHGELGRTFAETKFVHRTITYSSILQHN
jgi:hypothetical protein